MLTHLIEFSIIIIRVSVNSLIGTALQNALVTLIIKNKFGNPKNFVYFCLNYDSIINENAEEAEFDGK